MTGGLGSPVACFICICVGRLLGSLRLTHVRLFVPTKCREFGLGEVAFHIAERIAMLLDLHARGLGILRWKHGSTHCRGICELGLIDGGSEFLLALRGLCALMEQIGQRLNGLLLSAKLLSMGRPAFGDT